MSPFLIGFCHLVMGYPGGSVIKNIPASAGVATDVDSMSSQKDILKWEMATHSSILVKRIPWIKEPGGL